MSSNEEGASRARRHGGERGKVTANDGGCCENKCLLSGWLCRLHGLTKHLRPLVSLVNYVSGVDLQSVSPLHYLVTDDQQREDQHTSLFVSVILAMFKTRFVFNHSNKQSTRSIVTQTNAQQS